MLPSSYKTTSSLGTAFQRLLPVLYAFVGILTVAFIIINLFSIDSFANFNKPSTPQPFPIASLTDYLARWKDHIHTDNNLTVNNKHNYEIASDAYRWPKLGKKALILDVDTRYNDEAGSMFGDKLINKNNLQPHSAGYLNHYLYALIHGYDYRFVRAPEYTDRFNTWVKVPVIRKALEEYDFVVFVDSDAVFTQLNVPIEWLFSLWGINKSTIQSLPRDIDEKPWHDKNGWILWNTGVTIAQSKKETKTLYDKWERCPTGVNYPECQEWAYEPTHEQAAFSNLLRYEYNVTESFVVIPCMDANGSPAAAYKQTCEGVLITHNTYDKNAPTGQLYAHEGINNDVVEKLHQHFLKHRKTAYVDWSNESYPLRKELKLSGRSLTTSEMN